MAGLYLIPYIHVEVWWWEGGCVLGKISALLNESCNNLHSKGKDIPYTCNTQWAFISADIVRTF